MKYLVQPIALCLALVSSGPLWADEPERSGPWLLERSSQGKLTLIGDVTLHPAAEPQPALKHRLVPDAFDLVEGNSAIYYLKAMGFLEQSHSAKRIQEFRDKNRRLADEQGLPNSSVPPDVWLDMPPQQLPLAEVKEYLSYTSFQSPLLAEATRRVDFSLDRNIRQVESLIAYLLPEIQSMRELARLQSLRCRVALAEHRLPDAIRILNEQFTMARHLGSDEFVISNLVGAAIAGVAIVDAVYLLQEADAPNLYWALASLPSPIIDMRRALPLERQILTMQIKVLQEVDETPRPAGYWQDFVDRVLPQMRGLDLYDFGWLGRDPQIERAALVTAIAAAYPGAKRYLIDECQIERTQVDAYPTAQVVFLAMKRFSERTVDHQFKWYYLPYDQAMQHAEFRGLDDHHTAMSQRIGWASAPANVMLSGVQGIRSAQTRVQQQLELIQTIEAIRMYGSANAGKLPQTLADLPYPAPNDPASGKPFQYEVVADQAILSGLAFPNIQHRFKIRFAK